MPFSAGMPANLGMILSASPPHFHQYDPFGDFRFGGPLNGSRKFLPLSTAARRLNVDVAPIRPCLILKEDAPRGDCKKRVWFADDRGLSLTHVKVMSEPSDCPPRWTDAFIEHITSGIKALPVSEHRWEVQFPQPASDYLEFRRKVDRDCVSLENVVVREETVTGTVKVRNLSFHKEVFVRFTFDRWVSHRDVEAEYVPSGIDSSTPHDAFKFSAELPALAVKFGVEFCVGFRCDEQEYWDNNAGVNYRLVAVRSQKDSQLLSTNQERFSDPVTADFDRWTEFASWNHLVNDSPYW